MGLTMWNDAFSNVVRFDQPLPGLKVEMEDCLVLLSAFALAIVVSVAVAGVCGSTVVISKGNEASQGNSRRY